jgi:hypothetical protein
MTKASVAAIALLLAATIAETAAQIPFPRPRPRGGPELPLPTIPLPRPRPLMEPEQPAGTEPAEAVPSACLLRLAPTFARATAVLKLSGPSECGAEDVVQLSAVVTNAGHVAITPPATLRCSMAEAVVHWVRDDLAPAAAELGSPLAAIANFASYECRGRNRIVGAKLSEHGKANALDVRALKLANGTTVELTDARVAKDLREKVRSGTCARFTTVLGPGSDGFHENHIHVDLAERRHGFRMCQWAVRVPGDDVPLPRERPPEAPPRAEGAAR